MQTPVLSRSQRSLSGQWEGEVTSHPPGTGGVPSIHGIYLSYIFYYLAINHHQLNTKMIMPTPSQCTGWTEVQLRPISPTCHVIITSQDALNIKSQMGDGPNLPIYPFFWTELWNFYRQKSSYSIRSRQPEIIEILRPPKRILSSFPSHPKTTEEHPRHTHTRSNAVTCVSVISMQCICIGIAAASGEGEVASAAPSLVCRGSPHDYRITNKTLKMIYWT